MRRQADAPLRRRQAELGAHGPAEPGPGVHLGRPGPFVEAAEDEQVHVLQARLQRSPDRQARMAAVTRPHHLTGEQRGEQRRIPLAGQRRRTGGGVPQLGHESGRGRARLAGPQPRGAALGVAGGQRLGKGNMGIQDRL